MLLGATGVKAVRNYVGEIEPRWLGTPSLVDVRSQFGFNKNSQKKSSVS